MTFEELQTATLDWASARGILEHSTPQAQCLKGLEELGELAAGIARNDGAIIADALGDVLVVQIILAELCGLDLVACLAGAYDEIRLRKGRMSPNGIFIKEDPAFHLAEGAGHD